MRYVFGIALLALTGLGACSQGNQAQAPCTLPMVVDSTGECVSQPTFGGRRR